MARKENNQTVNLCLADVFKEQIDHLDKRKSQFTANNYRNVYRSVLDFVGDRKEIAEKSSLRRINRQLNKIGKMMGLKLTTYVARHSWASLLEECGFATSVISNGMGHGSERTTKKYLKGMPSQVIDNANEEMLNRLIRRNPTEDEKKCLLLSKNETSAICFFEPLVIKGYLLANVRVII